MIADLVAERFATEPITCAVMGLGYVGLPLAVTIAEAGLDVLGFDTSQEVVEQLAAGESNTVDVADDRVVAALASRLSLTTDSNALASADAIFICVPSPLSIHLQPDLSHIRRAVECLASVVRPGVFVSLESTTYPGTTSELLVPLLTQGDLGA